MPGAKTLLFVYNTDSGVLQSLKDYSAGPATAPGADSCRLSALTFSPVGMKKEWKRFLKELSVPSRSLDRNQFIGEFGHRQIAFPVVVVQSGPELSLLISSEELSACRDLHDLIQLIEERLPSV